MISHLLGKATIFVFILSCLAANITSAQWDIPKSDCPKGSLSQHHFLSGMLGNKRDVWVYLPASYKWLDGPYPLLIVFDGEAYTSELISAPTVLDNLIAQKKIPPLVAIFVGSINQKTRNKELPCYARFAASLNNELVPWISKRYFVTKNPALTVLAGSSYGGLAAAYAALSFPKRFGNVLSQSGAYWWSPSESSHEPWLISLYEKYPKAPINFYLDVGDQEMSESDPITMLELNRRFHVLLKNKGYRVTYQEFSGGHEYECWKKTFPDGLIALIGINKEEIGGR